MNQKQFIVPFERAETVNHFLSLGVIYFAKTSMRLTNKEFLGRDQSHLFPRSRVAPPNGKRLSEFVAKPLINPRWFPHL